MSATSEYEPAARQDYGPTTSSESMYESVLEHKLTDTTMSVPSVRTPVLRATPVSPTGRDPEPDSTHPEGIIQSVHNQDKEVEFHISEKECDTEMSVDTLSGIVRIEEATMDNTGRLTYPIVQEADDSSDGNYIENSATLIQAPMNTSIVQNVTKLPQNFTINVDAAVGNITAIQNLSQDVSGGQTLWLPTILATSTATTDNKNEEDQTQPGVSQFILTSESYVSDGNHVGRRNIVTETSYINRPKSSKVQILSNIPIPKNANYSQQYITNSKDLPSPVYGTQNHVYKLSTNVVPQKHVNNSVLCTKPPKNQSLIGCSNVASTMVNNSPVKNVSYSHTFTKTTNLNKTLSKVNNGANLNAMVAASSGNTQCHILSRVVSGPNKMSVHSGRKSVNTFKSKSSQVSSQKNQSRAIKIIQQTGTVHKSEGKSWAATGMATYKSQQPIYGVVDSNTSKIIQKVGSPPHKSQQTMPVSKFPAKGERLVLQSPCGPVLISTAPISTSMPKGPHYVQSGSPPNLRYVQTYGNSEQQLSTSQVSANQQLTAQILQSLSQPKLMFQTSPTNVNHTLVPPPPIIEELEPKPVNQRRIVFGDKSTLLTADDIIGMEERPNLSEEFRRYSFQSLAFVMLDHTYAHPMQKQPSPPPTSTPTALEPPAIPSPMQITTPMSPVKRISPVIMSTASYELPITTLTAPPISSCPLIPVSTTPMALTYTPLPAPPPDDDVASVISSLDGDRGQAARGGSDTETAPEGEEEGKTRCVCDFTHDDGYMICCDRCGEWQHVDCMGIDRNNIPDAYMCELCQPRPIDRRHARAIQMRKREELHALGASDSDSEWDNTRMPGQRRKRLLTVTTYTNTSGSSVTTYNSVVPVIPPAPQPTLPLPKRGPKRPKKAEVVRKGTKRKLTEKRVKRKREMMMNRSKYNSNLSNPSHWQDSFEQAVTNHYSPELRAKIMKYSSKLGNTANMASAVTAHLCTTVPHAGGKILIATKDLKENTPIIELRGKYMLSNQHRPQLQNSARAGSQKPGPFVFFYRLPKDNTQICIDTRTYGNEARFVRRSCKPNAELQHCIVKGTLHVYLVTIGIIQSNTEITVGHDSNGAKQPCACGNPKHCKLNGVTSMAARKSIDYPPREKRSRNRCSSSSSPASPPPVPITPIKEHLPPITPIKAEIQSPIKHEYNMTPMSPPFKNTVHPLELDRPMKAEISDFKIDNKADLTAKEEMKPEIDEPDYAIKQEPPVEEKVEPKVELDMVKVEETVIKPVPKEVEELKMEEMKVEDIPTPETASPLPEIPVPDHPEVPEKIEEKPKEEEEKPVEEERPATREFTAKSACHDRSARTSRTTITNHDSMDDKTDDSQDKILSSAKKEKEKKMTREERKMEAIIKAFERLEKAEQRKQEVKERQKRRESDPHPNAIEKDDEDEHCTSKKRRKRKGRARTTSQSNRRRLNSADSDMVTSGDEAAPPRTPPRAAVRRDSAVPTAEDNRNSDHRVTEDLGLSSACLLVEAAVGSVESAFKLPKTKKTMATEWIGRSPERTPSPYRSPYRPTLVSAPSLESLVRVASTIIGDLSGQDIEHEDETQPSPPRTPGRDRSRPPKKAKRITRNTPPTEVPEVTPTVMPQHSAKKRWLRQAISEESDSPNAESPPNEMVTPLKKRRLARESISLEQNSIVPCNDETSPVLTSEESPVKDDTQTGNRQYKVRNIMESIYGSRDRTRSDSGQGSDDQCNIDSDVLNVNIKGPHDTENIRRIIGVPTPEEELPPELPKTDDFKTNNNNIEEESGYNKVVPMEIDNTIPQPKIESNDNSNCELKGIESPNEKLNSSQSADTSGNSSPQRDEMDDIQKKIHSFHTENILILKSRNKKPPKEKRKKVNLNFDLNMVDDQISIQLRTDDTNSSEVNGEHDDAAHDVALENIPFPPAESIPLPAPENIPLPEEPVPMPTILPPEAIPLPEEPMTPVRPVIRPQTPPEKIEEKEKPAFIDRPLVKSRNKKPPKEKRKKVNLNFDLNMVDDQISIQLRTDDTNSSEVNGEHEDAGQDDAKLHVYPENIPLPPVESIPLPAPENIPLPVEPVPMPTIPPPEAIPLPEEPMTPVRPVIRPQTPPEKIEDKEKPAFIDRPLVKSRNKKPPKEKRKKVNLNFDLNMVDDQISVQLRTDDTNSSEVNGEHDDAAHDVALENIPLPPAESIPLPAPENIPLPEGPVPMPTIPPPEAIPLPEEPMTPVRPVIRPQSPPEKIEEKEKPAFMDRPSVLDNSTVPFSSRFSSTGLFSGIFSNMSSTFHTDTSVNENVPNMSLIKSAIDRTTSFDSMFDKDSITPADELKSVQEILTRVNNMDSNNSVLLSGVLKSSNKSSLLSPTSSPKPAAKPFGVRVNDPRLNPPPAEKPKPVRRKLSISEYRKRHKVTTSTDDTSQPASEGGDEGAECESREGGQPHPDWSSSSAESAAGAGGAGGGLDAAAAAAVDELEQRLHKELSASHLPKATVFDAQPTASERQREKLSLRLRREFGFALPDDEEARVSPSQVAATLPLPAVSAACTAAPGSPGEASGAGGAGGARAGAGAVPLTKRCDR